MFAVCNECKYCGVGASDNDDLAPDDLPRHCVEVNKYGVCHEFTRNS